MNRPNHYPEQLVSLPATNVVLGTYAFTASCLLVHGGVLAGALFMYGLASNEASDDPQVAEERERWKPSPRDVSKYLDNCGGTMASCELTCANRVHGTCFDLGQALALSAEEADRRRAIDVFQANCDVTVQAPHGAGGAVGPFRTV